MNNNLKEIRKRSGYSQKEIANLLKVSKSSVSLWESGKVSPSNENLFALSKIYGVSMEVLLSRDPDMDISNNEVSALVNTYTIPIINHVRANQDPFEKSNIIGNLEVGIALKKMYPITYAITVTNDTMYPEIHIWDRAIVSPDTPVNDNDMGIVCVNGDDGFIKRVKRTDEGIELIPENQKYGIIKYTNEQIENIPVLICGKVIGIHRFYV